MDIAINKSCLIDGLFQILIKHGVIVCNLNGFETTTTAIRKAGFQMT